MATQAELIEQIESPPASPGDSPPSPLPGNNSGKVATDEVVEQGKVEEKEVWYQIRVLIFSYE